MRAFERFGMGAVKRYRPGGLITHEGVGPRADHDRDG